MGFLIPKPTSLFVYHKDAIKLHFLVYIDSAIIISNCFNSITQFIKTLSLKFFVKDLGVLHYFLGVEVIPKPWSISYPTKIPSRSF